MSNHLIVIDTVDDRREVWHLLHRLPPHTRLAYLRWCCEQVADPLTGNGPKPMFTRAAVRDAGRCDRGDERLTNAVYSDWLALVGQVQVVGRRSLDPVKAAEELERWGRAAGIGPGAAIGHLG